MQTEQSNDKEVETGELLCERDAMLVAAFYKQLILDKIPEEVAKDLTIAYIVKPPVLAQ